MPYPGLQHRSDAVRPPAALHEGREEAEPTRGSCGGRALRHLRHPFLHDRRADPRRPANDVQLGDLREAAAPAQAADGRPDQGPVQADTALDHRVLLGLQAPRSQGPADADPHPLDGRSAACGVGERGEHFFWFSLRDHTDPVAPKATVQSGLYFRGAEPRGRQAKEGPLTPSASPLSPTRGQGQVFLIWGRTPNSMARQGRDPAFSGGGWKRLGATRADKAGIFQGQAQSCYGRGKSGAVRAIYRGQTAPPFSMRPVKDFHHPPFG